MGWGTEVKMPWARPPLAAVGWFTRMCGKRQSIGPQARLGEDGCCAYFPFVWPVPVECISWTVFTAGRHEVWCFFYWSRVGIESLRKYSDFLKIWVLLEPLITLVLLYLNFLILPQSPIRILWKLPVGLMWWVARWNLPLLVLLVGSWGTS